MPAAVLDVPAEGPPLRTEQDALDLIGATYGLDVETVALPVERLDPAVWRLGNGLLGGFVQKFVNYGLRLAIVGDLSAHLARSAPLADFVRESNRRGRELRFVADRSELEALS